MLYSNFLIFHRLFVHIKLTESLMEKGIYEIILIIKNI